MTAAGAPTIQGLNSPDHGFGTLGQFAHAVTAVYLDEAPKAPAFHIGYNTLPDPPYPMPSRICHQQDTQEAWLGCGQDLSVFLESGARSLRAQPVPDGDSLDEQARIMQYLLRIDAMALAWKAHMVQPTRSVASWTLAADLLAGKAAPADIGPEGSEEALVTWAIDRAGMALLAWAPVNGAEDDIAVAAGAVAAPGDIAGLLGEVLHAQYAWTVATFGTEPPAAISSLTDILRNPGQN
ncbi:MAG TPA: hypothetical protein VMU95_08720 [Trebonia sp.]|nr:hypothetical protein [Trebonia sp.]